MPTTDPNVIKRGLSIKSLSVEELLVKRQETLSSLELYKYFLANPQDRDGCFLTDYELQRQIALDENELAILCMAIRMAESLKGKTIDLYV